MKKDTRINIHLTSHQTQKEREKQGSMKSQIKMTPNPWFQINWISEMNYPIYEFTTSRHTHYIIKANQTGNQQKE